MLPIGIVFVFNRILGKRLELYGVGKSISRDASAGDRSKVASVNLDGRGLTYVVELDARYLLSLRLLPF
jgi:hypothetical protein